MYVRFVVGLVTAALALLIGSASARCDLKIVTLTHVDCSRLLVDGSQMSRDQLADLQTDPTFSDVGLVSTIWVKGDTYRVDQSGLTTITNTVSGEVTVIDRVNELYYILPQEKSTQAPRQLPPSTRLMAKSQPSVAFGYSAETTDAQLQWQNCKLTCTVLCTHELSALPTGLMIAVPAVSDLLPKLTGLPLQLAGTVSMPKFMGRMGFDWRITSLSTTTFAASELLPPAGFRKIDPPNPAQGMRIAVEAQVAVDPAIAVTH